MPALFSYSNMCPDLHLSTLSQGCVMRTTVFVSTLTSIWLFMELSRRMGKLASRLVRPKGWALAKKEKPLTLPGPHRVAQGLRESLARIILVNVYHWARQEEAMKQVHTLFPRLEGVPWLPSFLLVGGPCSALLFFIIKNILEINIFHSKGFVHLSVNISV